MKKQRHIWMLAVVLTALVFSLVFISGFGSSSLWTRSRNNSISQAATNAAPVQQDSLDLLLATQDALARIYDKAAPSVVHIEVTLDAQSGAMPFGEGIPFGERMPFDEPGIMPFGEGMPFEGPGMPMPGQAQSQGSGFVFDTAGHIVTNNHVIEGATGIVVNFANGRWARARLVASDPQADLAVLKATPPSGMILQPLALAPPHDLRAGHFALALGSPFGLEETMTLGVVSALGRSFPMSGRSGGASYALPDVLQTDTAINPGNSGGPLLNLRGHVVGVNFAINSPVESYAGVGSAIPVAVVAKVVPALISEGAYHYSYLGFAGDTVDASLSEQMNLGDDIQGVYVGEVMLSGPADLAGLRGDDIITRIDGQPVHRFEDILSYLFHATTPGQTVQIHILRDGQESVLDVALAERPTAT